MHYHVEGNEVEYCADIYAALTDIEWWIDGEADAFWQSAMAMRDKNDSTYYNPELACEEWIKADNLSNILLNIKSITEQWAGRRPRAPLYAGDDGDALLLQTAERMVQIVNAETRYNIWPCEEECETDEDPA